MEIRFGPIERRAIVLETLRRSPHGLSVKDIARQLKERGIQVTEKTSQRIIDGLIANNYPIEENYDSSRGKGRYYSLPKGYNPDTVLNLNPIEIEAVYVALGLMSPLKKTKYYQNLENLTKHLDALIPRKSRKALQQLRDEMSFDDKSFMIHDVNEDILKAIRLCIYVGYYLKGEYHTAYKGKTETKLIGPEKLFIYNGNTYLIGTDKGEPRTYVVHRFLEVTPLPDRTYEKKNLDPNELFKNSIGIMNNGPLKEVRLKFVKEFTPYIKERVFHHSQKITVNKDGTTTLTMKLVINEELVNWVLSFGTCVKIEGPESLIELFQNSVQELMKAD